MERLNEILTRTTHPRTESGEQSSTLPTPSHGSRPTAPPRRPIREQTAHLGPLSRPPHLRELYQESATSRNQLEKEAGRPWPPQQEQPRAAYAPYSRQHTSMSEVDAIPPSQQQAPHPAYDMQRSSFRTDGARSLQDDQFVPGRNQGYSYRIQADVQDEWEDDTADMRYGDWENDADDEASPPLPRDASGSAKIVPATNRAAARIMQTLPEGARQLITRELRSLPDAEPPLPVQRSQYTTRDLREIQMPAEGVPASPSFAEEPRRSHRFTQPLNQQRLARLSQHISPDAPHASQPARRDALPGQATPLIPAPYMPKGGVCPICKGAGYLRADVPYGHPNFGKPLACECKEIERKEKRRRQLQDISNLGDLRDKTFQNFRPNVSRPVQMAYQIALQYARNPEGWLVLIGKVGCGKTHLAAAIANQSLEDGAVVLFKTVSDLLDHLRTTYMPNSTEVYDQLFSKMREAELLVLDDLGAQQSSPWANEKLFQLFNYRYNSRFPTVITTNNAGLQGIDERIRSRMMDTSLVTTVTFDGAYDYRLRNPRRE
ncbi:MAG TPA: ATP-binding protein [Ktedonobacteraceae bacterium]|jgi:DNA replication protein DnaC|nr:ATP-binding protein [Ktedonobacteraceae bacterium]